MTRIYKCRICYESTVDFSKEPYHDQDFDKRSICGGCYQAKQRIVERHKIIKLNQQNK